MTTKSKKSILNLILIVSYLDIPKKTKKKIKDKHKGYLLNNSLKKINFIFLINIIILYLSLI